MSDLFIQEVETEINRRRGPKGRATIAIFRAILLLLPGLLVSWGLTLNGVAASYLFGIALTAILILLRGKKSTE